jgi:ABC-2 type transport system ATP-binding protein
MGHSVVADQGGVKAAIGLVPQEIALYNDLTARENLNFWGKMYNLRGGALQERVDGVLTMIGLEERQHDRLDTFSGGMRRRVNIAAALLHRPDVLIMDEPTVGIDPQSRRHILDSVKALNREGMTVLYTTHYMEEAQELSDQIAIMDQGEIIASGTHGELVKIVGEQDRLDLVLDGPAVSVVPVWEALPGVTQVTPLEATGEEEEEPEQEMEEVVFGHGVSLLVDDSNLVLPQLFERANAHGRRITSVEIREPNLETVFLHLTGRALRD